MNKLSNKNAVITSGGQGIGKAIALELLKQGCNVVISYFSSSNGAEEVLSFASRNNLKAQAVKADLTKETDCKEFIKTAVDFLGNIDILVNNAGSLLARRTLAELDNDFWQKTIDINMTSMLTITREALPYLEKNEAGTAIINLSSLAGRKGGHGGSLAYSTAKGAVLTWTRALATELGPKGIRVNALAPGLILGTSFHATHTTQDSAAQTVSQIPLQRAGTPEDIARATAFLASEYDGFISGATLDINGGIYCA